MNAPLSAEEFDCALLHFMTLNDSVGDTWQIRSYTNKTFKCQQLYMVKHECVQVPWKEMVPTFLESSGLDQVMDDDESIATGTSTNLQNNLCTLLLEYNVILSPSYGVPVMYLNASTSGRTSFLSHTHLLLHYRRTVCLF